ncbi:hypothetical protein I302_104212 [Kwoniella bestiolae CBS 10118]|uniref:Histidinol-phosphatase n=1 Tax=Kwoniella bestiolae CBS 10118 TaxID=1296100 RepID=A0A1B9GAP5_9TREE|nr:histidinol-phosphatase (PHP family) [Kwoniella bestiolae CBS 10118]OCF28070.1 histidinol-phosphatase (PHP family) [Kwoniella bestiolae CBS 10118]
MPHSHHSHSGQFCRHAKDQLEDVVKEAIRKRFEVFGLSEHAPRFRMEDLFPEEADLTPSDLLSTYLDFLSHASSLKSRYCHQISLLISLETDYITPLDLTNVSQLIQEHQEIDYIVGSVHHVNGISIDFDRSTWLRSVQASYRGIEGRTMDPGPPPSLELGDPSDTKIQDGYDPTEEELIPFLENYFDQQYKLIEHFKPEVIGHFDLCLLWIPDFSLRQISSIWEKVERNIKLVVGYGGSFEANSAAIRKGWKGSYPSEDVLKLILSLNGKICLSDDSHGISYVGLNYLKMRDYLVQHGVGEIWYLTPSGGKQEEDEEIRNGRRRVVSRRLRDWDKHSFWVDNDL